MLMLSQDISAFAHHWIYPVMSKCRYPVSAYSVSVKHFLIKVNDVTIEIMKIQELSSLKGE